MLGFRLLALSGFLFLNQTAVFANPIDIKSALQKVRTSARVEWLEDQREQERAEIAAEKINSAYDWQWENKFQQTTDELASQSKLYDKAEVTELTTGIKKLWSSGTITQFKLTSTETNLTFPAPPPPVQIGNNITIPAYDPSSSYQTNPEKSLKAEVTLMQPLWRNFIGKELKLQKMIARSQAINPKFQQEIKKQMFQAETEQFFWQLTAIRDKIRLTKELVRLQKNFIKEIKALVNLGRSEQVDLAKAHTVLVSHQGLLLELELAAESIAHRLHYRIDPNLIPPKPQLLLPSLSAQALSLPAPLKDDLLIAFAHKNRLDLKMLKAMKEPLGLQIALAKEKYKPQLDFFATYSINGIGSNISEIQEDSVDHSLVAVGITFNMPIYSFGYRPAIEEPTRQVAKVEAQWNQIQASVRKEIIETLLDHNHGMQTYKQVQTQMDTLKFQEKSERKRFLQARSDKATILLYQMETQSAKMKSIDALLKQRLAEARLRMICHSYPKN